MAKIAGIHQSIILNLTGVGSFTGGSLKIERIGNIVTITNIVAGAHPSAATAATPVGFVPTWARPQANTINVYATSTTSVRQIEVQADGLIAYQYRDWAGVNNPSTTTVISSITYTV